MARGQTGAGENSRHEGAGVHAYFSGRASRDDPEFTGRPGVGNMKVSRKQFLQTVAAAPLQAPKPASSTQRPPNVLILMSDQHRPDLMTCAGHDLVPTPHLDRIAENGVRFTNAYCPYPVCLGSRTSFP